MRRHLLVTNDFPPKVGGIQSYLWELWRRLPSEDVHVYTTPYESSSMFDAVEPYKIKRSIEPVLLPHPFLPNRIKKLSENFDAEMVIWDPALPVGLSAIRTGTPYGVILHGAEVTIPGRFPLTRFLLSKVLRGAAVVICAGNYPAAEAERAARQILPTLIIPPGVDIDRFKPLTQNEKNEVRKKLDLPIETPLVVSVSRLVPRKGMDTLIRAAAKLREAIPNVVVAIAGTGRDAKRLENLIETTGAPVRLLGRVNDDLLPGLYGAGDVFAMLCRSRLGGLEQEGFGIVFLEAAAAGVPQVAGNSGGAGDAVEDGETGMIVDPPDDPDAVALALKKLLTNEELRREMSVNSRKRAEKFFSYDYLAKKLEDGISSAKIK